MRYLIALGLIAGSLPLFGQQATARLLGSVFDPTSEFQQ